MAKQFFLIKKFRFIYSYFIAKKISKEIFFNVRIRIIKNMKISRKTGRNFRKSLEWPIEKKKTWEKSL